MNESEHISVGSCKILSKENSSSFNTGSLVVIGGIGCGDNLHVKKSVLCNDLGLKDNKIKFTNKNYIEFCNNVIPEHNQCCIGSNKNIWNTVFSKNIIFKNSLVGNNVNIENLNVNSNCLLGSNSILLKKGVEECLLNIDSRNNSITFKASNIFIKNHDSDENILEINKDNVNINSIFNLGYDNNLLLTADPFNKKIFINGELFVTAGIIKSFKKNIISCNTEIDIPSEINLLKIDAEHNIIVTVTTKANLATLTTGITKKIIIYQNKNNVDVKIIYGNYESVLKLEGDSLEILYDGAKWINIGKS